MEDAEFSFLNADQGYAGSIHLDWLGAIAALGAQALRQVSAGPAAAVCLE
jgi:hypothetical protein